MIIHTHLSPGLVALSVFVAALAGYIALDLVQRSTVVAGHSRRILIGAGGATMGLGIWSMHFIGMLSLHMAVPMSYDLVLVFLSMVAAILGSVIALAVVARPRVTFPDLFSAAIFMGLAVAAMHYLGMASMQMEASIDWNLPLVALSLAIAFGASLFALWLVMMIGRQRFRFRVGVRLAAAAILGIGVAGLHYTAMAAATFRMTMSEIGPGGSSIGSGSLVVLLVIGAAVMLAVLIASAAFDQRRAALATDLMQVAQLARDLSQDKDARACACTGIGEVTGADFVALLEPDEELRLVVTATAGEVTVDLNGGAGPAPSADLDGLGAEPELAALGEASGRQFFAPVDGHALARLGMSAALGQSLVLDGQPVGVLVLAWRERRRALDQRTASLLEMLVAEAAIAIDREDLIARLDFMARRDELTGLANRRILRDELDRGLERARLDDAPLALVMLDLDDFKRHNDRHGHQAGDRLLKTAAAGWLGLLREGDTLARYGGDEFIAVLPGSHLTAAFETAERLRLAVPGEATASLGIAEWDRSQSASQLIATADRALYDAKQAGRDRTSGLESAAGPTRPVV